MRQSPKFNNSFIIDCRSYMSLLLIHRIPHSAYQLSIKNRYQIKYLKLIFICLVTSTTPFELATISMGITYNNTVKGKGTLKAAWVSSSSELTNLAQLPTVLNTSTVGVIKIPGRTPPGAGNGSIISNITPGTKIGRLRLTNSTKFTSGQTYEFCLDIGSTISNINRCLCFQSKCKPNNDRFI